MNPAIIVILLLVLSLVIGIIFSRRYVACPPGKIMVIYGKVSNQNHHGFEIIPGGNKFIFPIIQSYEFIDTNPYKLEYTQTLQSKDEFIFKIKVKTSYAVSLRNDISVNAGFSLSGLTRKSVEDLANDIIYGDMLRLFKDKDMSDIKMELKHKDFHSKIYPYLNESLNKIGIEVISAHVSAIHDLEEITKELERENQHLLSSSTVVSSAIKDIVVQIADLNIAIEENGIQRNELLSQKLQLFTDLKKM